MIRRATPYTLFEMLVALAIFAMAAAAVGASAAGGLRIFARARTLDLAAENVLLSIERMERDIRNTFLLQGIGFSGTPTRLSVPGMVQVPRADGNPRQMPGRISYYVDRGSSSLTMQHDPYGVALDEDFRTRREYAAAAAEGIRDVRFEYLGFDPTARQFEWRTEWQADEAAPPVAVRMTLEPVVRMPFEMTRIVFVPIAQTRWRTVRQ